MEFRILGPLEVVDDKGAAVAVGGSRERAVLALLLLSANRVVSSERLAEDLWGDHPPDGAAHALRVHLSRLRKALREAGGDGIVVTQSPGYVARVDTADLDATHFESLAAQARELAAGGQHEQAGATLREALGLWRGPALADVADAPLARAEAARLEEARLAALADRIETDLACGRHAQLVAELEALTRAHPLRERLWAHRMVALYRAGRQAEALRAYQQLRTILGDELGLEPDSALQRLEGAILRHEPELDWPSAGEAERPVSPVAPVPSVPGGVVAFLFTDLVGSTELLDSLGEDTAEELRRTHFALLRQAVTDAGGEEVKSLGDGLMVVFASPLAALRCAVAIQEAVAEHNRSAPERALHVRVGLHAGEPVRAEEDFFGTAVVVARRLCDRAEGGQILASALVADLVGSRGGHLFTSLGPLELKGLAASVTTVAVEWERSRGDESDEGDGSAGQPVPAPPMPALLTEMGRLFVGRDAELKQLERLWAESEEGQLRLALLSGEPGVGKTRLAGELARMLHSEGSTVLAGRCDEDLGVPYQPFVEALHYFVEHTPPTLLARRLGRRAGELVRIYPDLTDRVRGLAPPQRSDPETERYRLFEAVAAWLAAASSSQPMLLVLDDLQWATKPTLLLLRHVMRSAGPQHLLVLGIYRDTELSHDHPLTELLADFRRQPGAERVALSGLDEADVVSLMTRAAGHELDNDSLALARVIHTESDGNPFFVREIIRHLTETGGIEQRDGRWGTPLPVDQLVVPEGIREVVGRRVSRLSADSGHALRVAAVVGPEFDLAVLGAAGELDEDQVLCSVEEAIATRLAVEVPGPVPRYRFTHALVRGTLYGELSGARRATLHRKVALAIEAVHPGADDRLPALAYHWARAASPAAETDRAVDYATRAGDHALAQLAHDEAANYYANALELLDASGADADDPRRLELLISRGNAQRQAGDNGYRQILLDAAELARRVGDAPALARAALGNTRGHMWTGVYQVDADRIEVLEAAIAAIGQTDLPVRARLLATLGLELAWAPDADRRLALSEEALGIARSIQDPAALAQVLLARDYTIHSPDNLPERFAATTELLAIAERLSDPILASRALSLRFKAAMELADVVEAEACVARNEELVSDLGQPTLTWAARQHRATLHVLRADAEAEGAMAASKELAPDGLGEFFNAAQRYPLRLAQGRPEDIEPFISALVARSPNPQVKSVHAHILAEMGQIDAAAGLFDEFAASDFVFPMNNVAWLCYGPECAWLCARLGRTDCVPRLRAWLEPYADQLVVGAFSAMVTGSVALYLGLLCTTIGDWPAADAHFATAAATHERIGATIWLARTQVEWARMLLARNEPGDDKRAGELLNQAVITGVDLELAAIEREARSLLGQ
jgi:DNA-binding SARP family transcriptional activator/class 3 adenylate cyclase/DNA polymerase III delta prime subunit